MKRVFGNEHWTLDRDTERPLLVLRRTPVPYPSISVAVRAFDELEAALDEGGRSRHCLLVDFRETSGRNDPDFERATAGFPKRIIRDFIRVAVLVRTALGALHIRRAAGPLADRSPPFSSEVEAMEHLFPPASGAKPPLAS